MTKERPIIFAGWAIPQLLDGSKTQTRRIVKPQPRSSWLGYMITSPGVATLCGPDYPDGDDDDVRCPYGAPGDRLWVREEFKADELSRAVIEKAGLPPLEPDHFRATLEYRATPGEHLTRDVHGEHWALWLEGGWKKWKPSIHMPRWASRILLELTDVRVERLQDIGEGDAGAEGFPPSVPPSDLLPRPTTARERFTGVWNDIHGPGAWDANPWVWVLSFKRIDNNQRQEEGYA